MRRCFRQRSLYGVAVIPRPAKTVWLLMNMSFREENTAPCVTMRSLAIFGLDMMTKSWLPSHTEYRLPNLFAHLSSVSSGYFVRNGKDPDGLLSF